MTRMWTGITARRSDVLVRDIWKPLDMSKCSFSTSSILHRRQKDDKDSFENKIALVTGGASGIGLQCVKSLLNRGCLGVTIADSDAAMGERALKEICEEFGGNRAIYIKCDVTKSELLDWAFKNTLRAYNRLDIVVSNAGILNDKAWEKTLATNVAGHLVTNLLSLQYMSCSCSGNGGTVVNIASTMGLSPYSGVPIYSMSQSGIIGLTRALGDGCQLYRTGVSVMALCAGLTDTKLLKDPSERTINEKFSKEFIEEIEGETLQSTESVGKALIEVIKTNESGSVWVVENDESPVKINMPELIELKTCRKKKQSKKVACGEDICKKKKAAQSQSANSEEAQESKSQKEDQKKEEKKSTTDSKKKDPCEELKKKAAEEKASKGKKVCEQPKKESSKKKKEEKKSTADSKKKDPCEELKKKVLEEKAPKGKKGGEPPKKEASKKGPPKKEPPKKESPKKDPPKKEQPKKESDAKKGCEEVIKPCASKKEKSKSKGEKSKGEKPCSEPPPVLDCSKVKSSKPQMTPNSELCPDQKSKAKSRDAQAKQEKPERVKQEIAATEECEGEGDVAKPKEAKPTTNLLCRVLQKMNLCKSSAQSAKKSKAGTKSMSECELRKVSSVTKSKPVRRSDAQPEEGAPKTPADACVPIKTKGTKLNPDISQKFACPPPSQKVKTEPDDAQKSSQPQPKQEEPCEEPKKKEPKQEAKQVNKEEQKKAEAPPCWPQPGARQDCPKPPPGYGVCLQDGKPVLCCLQQPAAAAQQSDAVEEEKTQTKKENGAGDGSSEQSKPKKAVSAYDKCPKFEYLCPSKRTADKAKEKSSDKEKSAKNGTKDGVKCPPKDPPPPKKNNGSDSKQKAGKTSEGKK